MIDLSAHAHESHRRDEPRTCPHCDRRIIWHDYSGLATQSWHYVDYIIAQSVISTTAKEEIDSPHIVAKQECGYCRHSLVESDFH